MILLYNTLFFVFVFIALPILLPMVFLSEKRRNTLRHRLGFLRTDWQRARGSRKPVWVHALSVGEVLSAAPLLSGLREQYPAHPLVLTVSTLTGYEIARKQLGNVTTAIRFAPLDFPFTMKRAVHHMDPALVLIVETDIWPNLLFQLNHRRIPVFLVNARLSRRSYRGYRRFSFFFRPLFSAFTRICVQSDTDARRFAGLGVPPHRIDLTGNIKFDQTRPAPCPEALEKRRQSLAIGPSQPVIVAGSTHTGEEEILLEGIRRLKEQWPSLVLIIAPRNPKRADHVTQLGKSMGLHVIPLTASRKGTPAPDVVVVDVLGLLRDLYALADIAFVGGSLMPHRGHNPLEPAAWAKPVLFGPDMSDFMAISQALTTAGGAITVRDAQSLSQAASRLLSHPEEKETMGNRALGVFMANGGSVAKTLDAVASHL